MNEHDWAYEKFVATFITQFASLEFHLRRLLQMHAGLSDNLFGILLGTPRTSDSLAKLRKLIPDENYPAPVMGEINASFGQLKVLGGLRNWIVHYGGHSLEGGMFLIRLGPNERARETGENFLRLAGSDAWGAVHDLSTANNLLMAHLDPTIPQGFFNMEVLRQQLPWRYQSPGVIG